MTTQTPLPNRPMVIAHRGASGHAPENSLEAFFVAASLGADGVELDVHATADGAIVVHHDPVIGGIGPIRDLPFDRAREVRLSNGEAIPLLAEVLETVPALEVWIEVKELDPRWDGRLLELIDRDRRPDRCGVHSFDHRLIARLASQRPTLRRGILSTSYLLDPAAQLPGTGATALWQEWHLVDRQLVERMGGAGVGVIAWTVNETRDATILAGLGVAGLCGNYPERLMPTRFPPSD